MRWAKRKKILASFWFFAVAYIVLAIIGGVRSYSPVPFMDMWDGFLDSFIRVLAGDFDALWAQHNEHRIILARTLFWIDQSLFQGAAIFLIVANYVFVALSFVFLNVCLRDRLKEVKDKSTKTIIGLLILILVFSWIQEENLKWGFQSQFFLAQLLPFIAFFLLHKAYVSRSHSTTLFVFASLLGVASIGSMANGVLALPLMGLLAAILRMGWRRITTLFLLAALTTTCYFYDYYTPSAHGSVKDAFLHNPIDLLRYLLLYLGGPFYVMTGSGSEFISQVAGLFLVCSCIFFAQRALVDRSRSSLELALLTFLLYIGGTALGTGGGRLNFGVSHATASRYMTPSLMAWSALLILYAPAIAARSNSNPSRVLLPLLLVPVLLLPHQLEALGPRTDDLFERTVAALALELGIADKQQITTVHPSAESTLAVAEVAKQTNLSIFANPLINDAAQLIGQLEQGRSTVQCSGSLEKHFPIGGDSRYVRIRGWLFEGESKTAPQKIHILDNDGRIVGYAIIGRTRPDLEQTHPGADLSGFKGYLQSEQVGKSIILKGLNPDCELKTSTPMAPFPAKGNGPASASRS